MKNKLTSIIITVLMCLYLFTGAGFASSSAITITGASYDASTGTITVTGTANCSWVSIFVYKPNHIDYLYINMQVTSGGFTGEFTCGDLGSGVYTVKVADSDIEGGSFVTSTFTISPPPSNGTSGSSSSGGSPSGSGSSGSTPPTQTPATPTPTDQTKPTEPPKPADPVKPVEPSKPATVADKQEKALSDTLSQAAADKETKEDIQALIQSDKPADVVNSFKDIVKDLKDSSSLSVVEQSVELAVSKVGSVDPGEKSIKTEKATTVVTVGKDLAKQLLDKASAVADLDKTVAEYEKKTKTDVEYDKGVTLNVPKDKKANGVSVGLSMAVVKDLNKSVDSLTISSPLADINLSLDAISGIKADTISVSASKSAAVSNATKKIAGQNEVFTIACSATAGKKTSAVTKVSEPSSIQIPVDTSKYKTSTVTVKCIQNGKVVDTIKATIDKTTGALVFDTKYFGDFVIVK